MMPYFFRALFLAALMLLSHVSAASALLGHVVGITDGDMATTEEWIEVGGNEKQTIYANLATIHKAEKGVTMWSLMDLKTPDTTTTRSYLSMKMLNEFNCKEGLYRFLASSNHSKNMGGGEVVYRNNTIANWHPTPPTSAVKALWKVACIK